MATATYLARTSGQALLAAYYINIMLLPGALRLALATLSSDAMLAGTNALGKPISPGRPFQSGAQPQQRKQVLVTVQTSGQARGFLSLEGIVGTAAPFSRGYSAQYGS
ncbi:hypothetical protein B5807_06070 [Epicoccum nigrum]|jgi:hypothetical protein|uniref:Uncharacterized protein n=1 Tax=Epicoccum nigrum TaxID=105696 RepID=A0A1Y2M0V5_EPING|nr:hypothetical protein B5807_06070 [Epicoccum nigrum]